MKAVGAGGTCGGAQGQGNSMQLAGGRECVDVFVAGGQIGRPSQMGCLSTTVRGLLQLSRPKLTHRPGTIQPEPSRRYVFRRGAACVREN
eukprot:376950-Rhodomonas_salina.1